MTDAEVEIYGKEMGKFFQRANTTPDFPRAAEIWQTFWDRKFPETPIDGIIALDPVGMSYLLEGTGPVRVGDLTLNSENLVAELLKDPYLELEGPAQDRLFAQATKAIFDRMTGELRSPLTVVGGLSRAAREGRFLVAPFDEEVRAELEGSHVEGALRTEPTDTPYVDIGVDAANGTKMSYYLRYYGSVTSRGCRDGVQQLSGTVTLRQSISPEDARELPDSVTGGGQYGTAPGEQLVRMWIYAPYGGSFGAAMTLKLVESVKARRAAPKAASPTIAA